MIAGGSYKRKSPSAIRGTGYVVESLEATLWAFQDSNGNYILYLDTSSVLSSYRRQFKSDRILFNQVQCMSDSIRDNDSRIARIHASPLKKPCHNSFY